MSMNFGATPPQSESATKLAYGRLRNLLLTGELTPGEKLKINRLREVLNVGASPIREALSLLVSDRLVERREQRGFYAAQTSRPNFIEILSLRCTLEEKALRQAMARTTDGWIEDLVLAHHRMKRSKTGSPENFEVQHKNFHMALIGNCNAPLLLRFCDQLYDLNIRYRYLAGRSPGYTGRSVDVEHQRILDGVVAGDADRAVGLLMSHYETTGAFLEAYIV